MNWLKRIFNWKKAPKATNEMKPVDMDKYTVGYDPFLHIGDGIKNYTLFAYNHVKSKWHRSPREYSVYYNNDHPLYLDVINNNSICRKSFQDKNNVIVGNLYTLYQQYYGKENKD